MRTLRKRLTILNTTITTLKTNQAIKALFDGTKNSNTQTYIDASATWISSNHKAALQTPAHEEGVFCDYVCLFVELQDSLKFEQWHKTYIQAEKSIKDALSQNQKSQENSQKLIVQETNKKCLLNQKVTDETATLSSQQQILATTENNSPKSIDRINNNLRKQHTKLKSTRKN